ncbi:glycosyltransferase-like protein LARGE1 [Blastocystis sp. ATCC 50177/Nand II]|uniref:Glycosyltransferase-like protein LARGE1 n=1 Tax=Blastocystis sp. subtype 1 (strain ATCC 50177 / NandII) TaxID=478820 RepID=A0A196SH45_BLAHN|nr:glycosyltransferase-like protein LARGE1 [Blastocystis sp. ATCC 50177/Nand II]
MQGIVLSSPLYHNRVTPTQNAPFPFNSSIALKRAPFLSISFILSSLKPFIHFMARSRFIPIILCFLLLSLSILFRVSLNRIGGYLTSNVEYVLGSSSSSLPTTGEEQPRGIQVNPEKVPTPPSTVLPEASPFPSTDEHPENTPIEEDTIPTTNLPPSPTITTPLNTTQPPSSLWTRHPRNTKPHSPYNDIYRNTRNPHSIARHGEFEFRQDHRLKYYVGSTPASAPQNQTAFPSSFDVTMISQTSTERLFYFPHLLGRWGGFMSITIFVHQKEQAEVEAFIAQGAFPARLRLTLYVVDVGRPDCVFHRAGRKLKCIPEKIYPLNRLRNLAIANVLTSHFVVFDMDMWPARNAYQTLITLPQTYLANPYNVMIVPAFSMPPNYFYSRKCTTLQSCIELVMQDYPETKSDMVRCLRSSGCTIFRPLSLTHNYLPKKWTSFGANVKYTRVPCFKERFLEPYVMVKRSEYLPRFDERFINYGFNKVQWIEHLRYLGYEFSVLAQSYAVDMPHSLSDYAKKYNAGFKRNHVDMLTLYRRFLYDLRQSEKDESRILLCLPASINLNTFRH